MYGESILSLSWTAACIILEPSNLQICSREELHPTKLVILIANVLNWT